MARALPPKVALIARRPSALTRFCAPPDFLGAMRAGSCQVGPRSRASPGHPAAFHEAGQDLGGGSLLQRCVQGNVRGDFEGSRRRPSRRGRPGEEESGRGCGSGGGVVSSCRGEKKSR